MPLPISTEIHTRLVLGNKPDDDAILSAVAHLAMVIAPSGLSGISAKIDTADVVMMTNLGAA